MKVVRTIIDMIFAKKQLDKVGERVVFHELTDGESFYAGDISLTCFDIHSTKEKQHGFRAQLPDTTVVVCLGDEPYNPLNRSYVENADWMMCEAFCLYADRDKFKPYDKCHSTALDAGRLSAYTVSYRGEDDCHTQRKLHQGGCRELQGQYCRS